MYALVGDSMAVNYKDYIVIVISSFVALKRAAEDREGWRHRERMPSTCCTAEDYILMMMSSVV